VTNILHGVWLEQTSQCFRHIILQLNEQNNREHLYVHDTCKVEKGMLTRNLTSNVTSMHHVVSKITFVVLDLAQTFCKH
jgi:hypothetical protein